MKPIQKLIVTSVFTCLGVCPVFAAEQNNNAEDCATDILITRPRKAGTALEAKSKSEKFDSARWRHDRFLETKNRRFYMIKDLLQNYKLKGMTRKDLYALLGGPDKSFPAFARYNVYVDNKDNGRGTTCLDFAFNDDAVTDLRFVANDKRDAWSGVSSQTQEELQKCAQDYRGVIIVEYGGLRGKVRSTVELPLEEDDALLSEGVKHHALGQKAVWKPQEQKEHLNAAIHAFTKFLQKYPDELQVWKDLARAELEIGYYSAAVKDYSHVIQNSEPDFVYYSDRAEAYLRMGKLDESIADSTSSIDLLNPLLPNSVKRKIDTDGNFDWAYKWSTVRNYAYRAIAYLKKGKTDLARTDLDYAINVPNAGNRLALFVRGELFLHQKKYDEAIDDFKSILQNEHRTTSERTVTKELARTYDRSGRPQDAHDARARLKNCLNKDHPELTWVMKFLGWGVTAEKT